MPAIARAFAAGAARASGERARRRGTPLLSAHRSVEVARRSQATARARHATPVPTQRPRRRAADAGAVGPDEAEARRRTCRRAAPPATATRRAAHRASPPGPTRQASAKATTARPAYDRRARGPARRGRCGPPATLRGRPPCRGAAARADSRPARARRRTLTATQTDMSLPVPGIEELLSASIAAMRTAAQGAGISPEEVERQIAATLAFLRRRLDGRLLGRRVRLRRGLHRARASSRCCARSTEVVPGRGAGHREHPRRGRRPRRRATTRARSRWTRSWSRVAVHDEHPKHRILRVLGADLVFQTPVRRADRPPSAARPWPTNDDAERLLRQGRASSGSGPRGSRASASRSSERYKLQRFGRGGFVSAALGPACRSCPTSIVGAEEIYADPRQHADGGPTARHALRPDHPDLPAARPARARSRCRASGSSSSARRSRPRATAPAAADDPMLVFDLTDQVRETIQQTLYSLLMQRRSVFF